MQQDSNEVLTLHCVTLAVQAEFAGFLYLLFVSEQFVILVLDIRQFLLQYLGKTTYSMTSLPTGIN